MRKLYVASIISATLNGILMVPASGQIRLSDAVNGMTITISDAGTSPVTPIREVDEVANDAFRAFTVRALSAIRETLGRSSGEIHVVRIPVVAQSEGLFKQQKFTNHVTSSGCSIRSPWLDLDFTGGDTPRVYGVLIWNERQLLLDLSAVKTPDFVAPRQPYSQTEFERSAHQYGMAISDQRTEELLRNDIPSDLGELFRRSPQSTLIPFSANARAAMQKIAAESVNDHARIIGSLVGICASGKAGNYHFSLTSDVDI